ncbi:MAG: ATPase [Phycisphaerae bacterium SM23_33]|nr:MAG: ATPase [Phycisphaerae bacterium SM23_33]
MVIIGSDQKLQLGQLLIRSGALTEEQLEEALRVQRSGGNRLLLGEVLLEQGVCTEEQIMECLARGYGIPFARVSPKVADPNVVEVLPKEFLNKHCILPLFKVRGTLTMAVAEPANVFLLEEVARMTDCEVRVVCATARDIRNTLEIHVPSANVFVIDDIVDEMDAGELALVEDRGEDIADLEVAAANSPVVRTVNYLISSAVREGASDIHIEPEENVVRVRFRVDGRLYEKIRLPSKIRAALVSRIKIMSGLDISERRLPQDGGIHVLMEGRPVDLRVSTMNSRAGEKVVVRVIDKETVLVNIESLGFSYETLKQWQKAITAPNGIVLVTGPTGSGKSTTLYSVLKELSSDEVNICTIEDPIEFNLAWVNQFQTNEKIGFTFSSALRSLLRQDPDIVMVGEIRDAETARIAVQAALTGHLVLSTLHTNDAPGAITRLLNIGVEPYLVSASVVAVLAQRLVRKICPHCKEPYEPPASIRRAVERLCGEVETFYRGAGCSKCRNSGFSGRMGIFELLVPDDNLRDHITSSPSVNELRELAASAGMVSLRADGLAKVKAGMTAVEEVFRVCAA